jgi:glutamate-1-semialdehyde 2,1-aminomutase
LFTLPAISSLERLKQGISLPSTLPAEKSVLSDRLLGDEIRQGLSEIIGRLGVKAHVTGFGSVFVVYFMEPPVESYTDLLRNNSEMDLAFRWGMIERGIFIHPMCLKRSHVSAAHSKEDVVRTLEAAEQCLKGLKSATGW